jgi:hypothetical protein
MRRLRAVLRLPFRAPGRHNEARGRLRGAAPEPLCGAAFMGRRPAYGSRGVGGTARPRFDDGTSRARVSPRFAFFVHTAAICPAIQSCPALFTGGALGWPSIARLALTEAKIGLTIATAAKYARAGSPRLAAERDICNRLATRGLLPRRRRGIGNWVLPQRAHRSATSARRRRADADDRCARPPQAAVGLRDNCERHNT